MSENNIPGEVIKRDITRELAVQLTVEEIAQRARGFGEKAAALQKLKDEESEKTKRGKERVSNMQAEIDRITETLRTGTEPRLVSCHERFHAGTIITVRDDTGEIVGAPRPANQHERQLAMPNSTGNGSLLETAAKNQAAEGRGETDGEPEHQTGFDEDEEDQDDQDDDEPKESDEGATPKKRRGRKGK